MTSFDDFKKVMEQRGFKYQPQSRAAQDSSIGIFYRRLETKRPCRSNEKDQLVVECFDRAMFARSETDPVFKSFSNRFSFEVEITGEFSPELWSKLKVYGLGASALLERLDFIEAALVRAWEALA